jgi:hypothetical protein
MPEATMPTVPPMTDAAVDQILIPGPDGNQKIAGIHPDSEVARCVPPDRYECQSESPLGW